MDRNYIVVTSRLTHLSDHIWSDDCIGHIDEGHIDVRGNPAFPGRLAPLVEGCYEREKDSTYGLLDMPNDDYDAWREFLADMAHQVRVYNIWREPEKYADFMELIYFSNAYGALGTDVCRKLSIDFRENLEKAKAYCRNVLVALDAFHVDDWFLQVYGRFTRAFDAASDGGCMIYLPNQPEGAFGGAFEHF